MIKAKHSERESKRLEGDVKKETTTFTSYIERIGYWLDLNDLQSRVQWSFSI